MTTTEDNYDETLADARDELDEMFPRDGWPEGERDKDMNDALNNAWSEGMTVSEWAKAARALLPGQPTLTRLEVAQSLPEHARLEIVRDTKDGVVLVNDGQYRWAGELADWDASAAQPWPHGDGGGDSDTDDTPAMAYSELCGDTPQLDPSDPRVVRACERAGWDPEWIMAP